MAIIGSIEELWPSKVDRPLVKIISLKLADGKLSFPTLQGTMKLL